MIREKVMGTSTGERHFRWRGGDVSRIEGLTDAVIALSLTLLVVSLEVPSTFDQMMAAFVQLPVFAACFAVLYMIWIYHFNFHRRYGLEDGLSIFLNAVLIFLVLFYVYPLKFLFTTLYSIILHGEPLLLDAVGEPVPAPGGSPGQFLRTVSGGDMPMLMGLYGAGYGGIFGVMALQTLRAWSMRERLDLNAVERLVTRNSITGHLIQTGFGFVSMTMVIIEGSLAPWAGMLYCLVGPTMAVHGTRSGRAVERLALRESGGDA